MNAFPFICPGCGELVIAHAPDRNVVHLPTHPDRAFTAEQCPVQLVPAEQTYLAYIY